MKCNKKNRRHEPCRCIALGVIFVTAVGREEATENEIRFASWCSGMRGLLDVGRSAMLFSRVMGVVSTCKLQLIGAPLACTATAAAEGVQYSAEAAIKAKKLRGDKGLPSALTGNVVSGGGAIHVVALEDNGGNEIEVSSAF